MDGVRDALYTILNVVKVDISKLLFFFQFVSVHLTYCGPEKGNYMFLVIGGLVQC